MQRLLYVSATITRYRWPVLAELGRRGVHCRLLVAGSDVGVMAAAIPQGTAHLEPIYCPGKGLRYRTDVMNLAKAYRPDVVLLEHGASLDFAWTMLLRKRDLGVPHVIWTHGVNRRDLFAKGSSLAAVARWIQMRLADGILCYDPRSADGLRPKFRHKPIGFAPNSTDTADLIARRRLLSGARAALRLQAGMEAEYYVLTLGRLIRSKQFHKAIRVVSILRDRGLDVGLIVVGDGPEMRLVRECAESQGLTLGHNCHLLGEIADSQQLVAALTCADICVNPGPLGLSVTDCLATGLPIVALTPTEDGPYHGPEWTYVEEGKSGWFVEEHTEDALALTVEHYLQLPSVQRAAIEQYCMSVAERQLGIERLVDGMMELLHRVRTGPRGNGKSLPQMPAKVDE